MKVVLGEKVLVRHFDEMEPTDVDWRHDRHPYKDGSARRVLTSAEDLTESALADNLTRQNRPARERRVSSLGSIQRNADWQDGRRPASAPPGGFSTQRLGGPIADMKKLGGFTHPAARAFAGRCEVGDHRASERVAL
jgi:hypothetical protein